MKSKMRHAAQAGFTLITDVDQRIAENVDAAFDADDDLTSGAIRWDATVDGRGTLRFAVPVRGC